MHTSKHDNNHKAQSCTVETNGFMAKEGFNLEYTVCVICCLTLYLVGSGDSHVEFP